MKKFNKILLAITIYFSLTFLIFHAVNKAIPINYELISSKQSPDGSNRVYMYSVNSGASSDYSYRLTLSSNGNFDQVNKEKYFFHYDSNHGSASKDLKVEWLDSSNIKVTYDKNVRVFEQRNKMASVKIQYEKARE